MNERVNDSRIPLWQTFLVAVGAVVLAVLGNTTSGQAPRPAAAQAPGLTFVCTGNPQFWMVPAGIASITVEA